MRQLGAIGRQCLVVEFLEKGAEIYKVEQGTVDPRIAADD